MSTPKKPINEYTNDELEKLELQLWRAKYETSERLAAITNDLAVVNGMLTERTKSDDTHGQAAAS